MVTPGTAKVGESVTCSASATDADGGTPTLSYAWSSGDTGPSMIITSAGDPGDAITCTVTATDEDGGEGTGTGTVTIDNTAPEVDAVSISPDPAYNDDTLVCTATASDADGDTPTLSYQWTGGAIGASLPLTSIIAAPGDTLSCTATATDADGGTNERTGSITIGNRAPTGTAAISPADPTASDVLTCAVADASDPDDDATTVTYTWTIDGTPADADASGDTSTLSDLIAFEQDVVCTATIADSHGASTETTATVTIGNSPPEITDVSLAPTDVFTDDTVTATASTIEPDGQPLTFQYAFYVDDVLVQDSASATLDGSVHFDKGQTIQVTVTADDGLDSDTASSEVVSVRNSPPSAPTIEVFERDGVVGPALVAGRSHTCAISAEKAVSCWGDNGDGQASPPPGAFSSINGGDKDNCGVRSNSTLGCWGVDISGESTPPEGAFLSIDPGEGHTCALRTTGAAYCWGENVSGEASAPGGVFVAVSAGWDHSCGIRETGFVSAGVATHLGSQVHRQPPSVLSKQELDSPVASPQTKSCGAGAAMTTTEQPRRRVPSRQCHPGGITAVRSIPRTPFTVGAITARGKSMPRTGALPPWPLVVHTLAPSRKTPTTSSAGGTHGFILGVSPSLPQISDRASSAWWMKSRSTLTATQFPTPSPGMSMARITTTETSSYEGDVPSEVLGYERPGPARSHRMTVKTMVHRTRTPLRQRLVGRFNSVVPCLRLS